MSRRWKVHFDVGAEDSYYYADIWVHGLTDEEAKSLVWIVNALGNLHYIAFGDATMMGDGNTRPDLGFEQFTSKDGKTEVRFDHNRHVYHYYLRPDLMKLDGPLDERRDHEGMAYKTLHTERDGSMNPARASEANRRMDCLERGVSTRKTEDGTDARAE